MLIREEARSDEEVAHVAMCMLHVPAALKCRQSRLVQLIKR